jgi:flagellar basal-body rod modification protein FlgD
MTFIDPISGNASSAMFTTSPTPTAPTNTFDQDTFLKLLVAQLKYQNPMSPKDGTEFLTQTAQFTQLETLQKIEKLMTINSAASEVLEASTMVGRKVTMALPQGQGGIPVASTSMTFGGNLPSDAAVGTKVESTLTVLAKDGTKVPLRAQLTKLADGSNGETNWELRTFSSTTQISGPHTVTFDSSGNRTSPNPVITAAELNEVPSARGQWDVNGLSINLGGASDTLRLRVGEGASTFAGREHNGSDGTSITGIVTGVRFTIDGPLLRIGDRELPLNNVMEVQVAAT